MDHTAFCHYGMVMNQVIISILISSESCPDCFSILAPTKAKVCWKVQRMEESDMEGLTPALGKELSTGQFYFLEDSLADNI